MGKTRMIEVRLSGEERNMIRANMSRIGITNMSEYCRRMGMNGYCLVIDTEPIKELLSLVRYTDNNINQIIKIAEAAGDMTQEDIRTIRMRQKDIHDGLNTIVEKLSKLNTSKY